MTTLSIVIPAYNEEDGIAEIIHRVLAVKEKLIPVGVDDMELIVVDDGSADRTAEITEKVDIKTSSQRCQQYSYRHSYAAKNSNSRISIETRFPL